MNAIEQDILESHLEELERVRSQLAAERAAHAKTREAWAEELDRERAAHAKTWEALDRAEARSELNFAALEETRAQARQVLKDCAVLSKMHEREMSELAKRAENING